MDIRKLKQDAAGAMRVARDPKKAVLAYAGFLSLIALLTTLADMYLSREIAGTGGLANMGIRSVLSTVQTVLPLVQTVLLLCLELGYLSAVMRFTRKQYADHTDLRTGFEHFGPLLRMTLLEGAIYVGLLFVSTYLGTQIFLMTPLSRPMVEALTPMLESSMLSSGNLVLDDATMLQFEAASGPLLVIIGIVFALLALPVSYRYRMANYCLLDKPREGALAAMRHSRRMMRGNVFKLLKLDLSFWWYYLLMVAASVVCYGDQILLLMGISLPIPAMAGSFLFYGIYLVAQCAIYYFFRNEVEVTYVMAYEAIRPVEQDSGVVLGNIFDMQ